MALRRWILMLLVCAMNISASTSASAQPPLGEGAGAETVYGIAKGLMCPCPSCAGKALDQCEPGCHDGEEKRQEIVALMKQNKSREQIYAFMSATYGPQILGEPPREGWGILSIAIPLACLAGGSLPLLWFTRKRGAKSAKKQPVQKPSGEENARVEAALKDFDY